MTTPIFDRTEYLKAGETNDRGYKNSSGEDVGRARLHGDLEKYLLKLERNYSTRDLVYVLTIPRVRSHRLYENLVARELAGRASRVRPADRRVGVVSVHLKKPLVKRSERAYEAVGGREVYPAETRQSEGGSALSLRPAWTGEDRGKDLGCAAASGLDAG